MSLLNSIGLYHNYYSLCCVYNVLGVCTSSALPLVSRCYSRTVWIGDIIKNILYSKASVRRFITTNAVVQIHLVVAPSENGG